MSRTYCGMCSFVTLTSSDYSASYRNCESSVYVSSFETAGQRELVEWAPSGGSKAARNEREISTDTSALLKRRAWFCWLLAIVANKARLPQHAAAVSVVMQLTDVWHSRRNSSPTLMKFLSIIIITSTEYSTAEVHPSLYNKVDIGEYVGQNPSMPEYMDTSIWRM